MQDEELIEPAGVLEIYVDDFTGHARHNGNMSCVGVRDYPDGRTVVVRLIWPAANTSAAIEDATEAMAAPEMQASSASKRSGRKRDVH